MTAVKKTSSSESSAYKVAASARRARLAADTPILGEIKPVHGRIHITLGGKPLRPAAGSGIFGPSAIDIPEFSIVRKSKST